MESKTSIFFERISEVLISKGFKNLNDFAINGLGYSSSEKLNRLKDASKKPSVDILIDIANKFEDLDAGWLLTGKGQMQTKKAESAAQPSEKGIPLISLEAAAGFGNGAFSVSNEDIMGRYVVPDFVGIDFMLRVKGSSMYPKYSSGDVIACRVIHEISFIQWNKVYVIITREQGMLCKRIKKAENANQLLMVSDNKDYDPFEIDRSEITGIALVIGTIRLE